MKHIYLYYAPAVGIYMLRFCTFKMKDIILPS